MRPRCLWARDEWWLMSERVYLRVSRRQALSSAMVRGKNYDEGVPLGPGLCSPRTFMRGPCGGGASTEWLQLPCICPGFSRCTWALPPVRPDTLHSQWVSRNPDPCQALTKTRYDWYYIRGDKSNYSIFLTHTARAFIVATIFRRRLTYTKRGWMCAEWGVNLPW